MAAGSDRSGRRGSQRTSRHCDLHVAAQHDLSELQRRMVSLADAGAVGRDYAQIDDVASFVEDSREARTAIWRDESPAWRRSLRWSALLVTLFFYGQRRGEPRSYVAATTAKPAHRETRSAVATASTAPPFPSPSARGHWRAPVMLPARQQASRAERALRDVDATSEGYISDLPARRSPLLVTGGPRNREQVRSATKKAASGALSRAMLKFEVAAPTRPIEGSALQTEEPPMKKIARKPEGAAACFGNP